MAERIRRHTDLKVYQQAFKSGMTLFHLSKKFPKEERYSLTDQARRSSRSVCGSIAEAWRKRRYIKVFANKLNDAEAEAAETQSWIQFSVECGYVERDAAAELYREYDQVISMLVKMIHDADDWTY